MHIEKLELSDTQKILLYHDGDQMDENIIVVNKYSELHWVAVRSLVYTAEQTVCQLLFTR